jgi:hypothetical protein
VPERVDVHLHGCGCGIPGLLAFMGGMIGFFWPLTVWHGTLGTVLEVVWLAIIGLIFGMTALAVRHAREQALSPPPAPWSSPDQTLPLPPPDHISEI